MIVAFCFILGFAYSLLAPALLPVFAAPIAVLALLVIWVLPDSTKPPVRMLEWLFFAFFVVLVLWPDYLAIALPGLPWITLQRLTVFPMVFLLLLCVSTSAQFRRDMARSISEARPLAKLLIAFAVIQFLSIFLSQDKATSIQKFIVAQTNWTAVFFVAAYLFRKPGRLDRWVQLLWGGAIVVSLLAIWEFRIKRLPWAGHIPSFLKIEDPTVAGVVAGHMRAYTNIYRVQATFSTPLGLGEYLALAMPFVLELTTRRHVWQLRIAAIVSIPVLLYAVILTDARLGVIGCLLSFLVYGMFASGRLWKERRSSILGPAITLAYPAIFCVALAATFLVGNIRKKVWGGGAQQGSNGARIEQYHLGIGKIIANPFGYGIGRGAETLGFNPFGFLTIDTYYISVALEYGVLGFILYYGMIAVGITHAARRAFQLKSSAKSDLPLFVPLAISLINFLVIKSVFSQQDNHPIVYMMLGAIMALCSRPEPLSDSSETIIASPRKRRPSQAGISRAPTTSRPSI